MPRLYSRVLLCSVMSFSDGSVNTVPVVLSRSVQVVVSCLDLHCPYITVLRYLLSSDVSVLLEPSYLKLSHTHITSIIYNDMLYSGAPSYHMSCYSCPFLCCPFYLTRLHAQRNKLNAWPTTGEKLHPSPHTLSHSRPLLSYTQCPDECLIGGGTKSPFPDPL